MAEIELGIFWTAFHKQDWAELMFFKWEITENIYFLSNYNDKNYDCLLIWANIGCSYRYNDK